MAKRRKPRIITCKMCNREKPLAAFNMCFTCYAKSRPQSLRRKKEYGTRHLGKESITIYVPCMRCGRDVGVFMVKGEEDQADRRRFCSKCKDLKHTKGSLYVGYSNDDLTAHLKRAEEKWRKKHPIKREPVRHIKPTDAEFKRIASECTPPSKIKSREADTDYYWRSNY